MWSVNARATRLLCAMLYEPSLVAVFQELSNGSGPGRMKKNGDWKLSRGFHG
jgi:hypothetical protein